MTTGSAPLRAEVLGPVRAWCGANELALGGPRQRAVFAMLALRANRTVTRAELIDALWGQDPPASADSSIYTYVTGLRRAVEPERPGRAPGQVLVSGRAGYLLRLDDVALDANLFDEYRSKGRRHHTAGDLRDAARSFDAALQLWKGEPLGSIPGPFASIERTRLTEMLLAVYEERAEVFLALGKHGDLTLELRSLVQEYPMREGLRSKLMLALYRSGRQAEALELFQDTRRLLVDELGIEPGPELRCLHERILVTDPRLSPGAAIAANAAGRQTPPVPYRLEAALAELATAVARQWTAEIDRRSLRRPQPVQLRWSSTGRPVAAARSVVLDSKPEAGQRERLSLDGDLKDTVAKFRALPNRQIVVLGEPGAGKTVLAIFLTVGLLSERRPDDPVPVLLPVSSWNPCREHLHTWVARKLVDDYPGLGDAAVRGRRAAQLLLSDGKIMPVLDGLDEMPPGLHAAAIDAVDQAVAGGRPLVITCRSVEYETAVLCGGAILTTAAVVEIEPVRLDDALAFLTCRQPVGSVRWQEFAEYLRLHRDGPLAVTLTNALMVDLTRQAYTNPGTDPAELCDVMRFPDRASVEAHLLDAFLPAVYAGVPPPQAPSETARRAAYRCSLEQARPWLAFLAQHLQDAQTSDLAWWQLPYAIPPSTRGLALGIPPALLFAVTGEMAGGHVVAAVYGVSLALAGFTVNAFGSPPGPIRVEMRFRGTRSRFIGRFLIGLAIGVALGLSWSLSLGVIFVLIFVFGLALAVQVWLSIPVDASRVSGPFAVLKQERIATLMSALSLSFSVGTFYGVADAFTKQVRFVVVMNGSYDLVLALAAGLAGALFGRFSFGRLGSVAYGLACAAVGGMVFPRATTPAAGLLTGAMFGLAVALVLLLSRAWGSFAACAAWLALRGRMPLRIMRFLNDAHRRGVLRRAGAVYQFRHARLRDHLSGKPPADAG